MSWGSILAGLGAGASTLGNDLETKDLIEKQRQAAESDRAWQRIVQGAPLGISPVAPGQDPSDVMQSLINNRINQVAGPQTLNQIPGAGMIGNQAAPVNTQPIGQAFPYGQPKLLQAGGQSFVMDPSQSAAALSDRRLERQQKMVLDRQDSAEAARAALENQKEAAKAQQQQQQATRAAQADYLTLKTMDPSHPLAQAPFNPDYAATYSRELAATHQMQAEQAKQNAPPTAYQRAILGIQQQGLTLRQKALDAKGNQPTPDQIKSQTVESLATPAAEALIAYHGGDPGVGRTAAAIASHVPLVGNALEGKFDPAYQNAMNNARTLATQYLEIMPKSRFQPSTVDDILKQIAPALGDAAPQKAAKIARIKTLEMAIKKRAALRPDAPGPDLSDIPEPPGAE